MHRFRYTDELPEIVQPVRPATDAVSSWLGFHAYQLADAVFIQGRSIDEVPAEDHYNLADAEEDDAFALPPPVEWSDVEVVVDGTAESVRLRAPDGTCRVAVRRTGGGCVVLPSGVGAPWPRDVDDGISVNARLRVTEQQAAASLPNELPVDHTGPSGQRDPAAINRALDALFADGETRAVVVLHDGQLIAERYAAPFTAASRHACWSMTKSLVGAMIGRLIHLGHLDLDQSPQFPEWTEDDDERAAITVEDLLSMSSGLNCPAGASPWAAGDKHFKVYTGIPDIFSYSATLPLLAPPGSRCAYQNCDPLLAARLAAQTVMAQGLCDPAEAPWALLFDPIGMSSMTLGEDHKGNHVLSGWSTGTARDWARFGQLYLDDGVWRGERLLPKGWLEHASKPAPADDEEVYGRAFMWRGENFEGLPSGSLVAAGAFGQRTIVMPGHRAVIVRLGRGSEGPEFAARMADFVAGVLSPSGGGARDQK